jgi:hypothetical protein
MARTPFVWLGAGRARKRGVAEVTAVLDDIARAGLPVPAGAVLLDELYRILLNEGVVELTGTFIVVPDPIWLTEVIYRDVRLPRLAKPVFVGRADAEQIPAGAAPASDFSDPEQVAAALRRVWSEQEIDDAGARHDVLLIEQIAAKHAGTADIAEDKLVDHVLVDGTDTALELAQLRSFQGADAALPSYAQRLQKLLRGLRRTLDDGRWRIAWADDGAICWVTAVVAKR